MIACWLPLCRRLVAVLLGTFLYGCGDLPVGQGPITFSPKTEAFYRQYRDSFTPGAFVVTREGSAFYTYCSGMDCQAGAAREAMRMCRQRNIGDCYLYDVGGRVVWREDLPAPANPRVATAVAPEVAAERGRNALKVDCSNGLKRRLSAEEQASLGAALGVKSSRAAWTYCDRLVDGGPGGTGMTLSGARTGTGTTGGAAGDRSPAADAGSGATVTQRPGVTATASGTELERLRPKK